MKIVVRQSGNSIAVEGSDFTLRFDVEGTDLPPVDPGFAAWVLLPLMMRRGEDIAFEQPVDPVVLANANRLVEIWSIWLPGEYRPIAVTAPGGWVPHRGPRDEALHLYSGGVDSTFTLMAAGHRSPPGTALTVLGMDYHLAEEPRFGRLLAKTAPLLDLLGYRRVVVRANFREVFKGPISNAHAFVFASCQFLFKPLFTRAVMSADNTPEHDMLSFDSSNHVTNKYFAGTDFRMDTAGAADTRTDKIEALARRPDILPFLAFCTARTHKPENCGRCSKCIRTKAMFIAASGATPPIFDDMDFSWRHLARINVRVRRHYAFFADLAITARRNGTIHLLGDIEERLRRPGRWSSPTAASFNRLVLWLRNRRQRKASGRID